jgi:hypothetical protein
MVNKGITLAKQAASFVVGAYVGYIVCWVLGFNGIPKISVWQLVNICWLMGLGLLTRFFFSNINKYRIWWIFTSVCCFMLPLFAELASSSSRQTQAQLIWQGALLSGLRTVLVYSVGCGSLAAYLKYGGQEQ